MGNSSYSDLYGTQAGTHYGFEASQGIQPAFGQRPAYAPQNVQSQNPKDAAPKVWGRITAAAALVFADLVHYPFDRLGCRICPRHYSGGYAGKL